MPPVFKTAVAMALALTPATALGLLGDESKQQGGGLRRPENTADIEAFYDELARE